MEISKLKCFLEVCACESFSKAGQNLYMSQQGVSRIISSLEKELCVSLFTRTAKGVKPTKEGELVRLHAEKILNSYEAMLSELEKADERDDRIRLAATSGALFAAKPEFTELEHDHISIIDTYDYECERLVLEGAAPLGITVEPIDDKIFEVTPLRRFSLHIICGPSHPYAKRKSLKLSDLNNEHVIILRKNYKANRELRELFKDRKITPSRISETGYLLNMYQRCQGGAALGLAVLYPNSSYKSYGCTAVPLDEEIYWSLCLINDRSKKLSKPELRLKEKLKDMF